MKKLPDIQPGEVLLEEFFNSMGINPNAMARAINVCRAASTKSYSASAPSQPLPPSGWRLISALRRVSGWASKPISILSEHARRSGKPCCT